MGYSVAATHTIKRGVVIQGLDQVSSTQLHDPGYSVETTDGRVYEYVFLSTTMDVAPIATYPAFLFESITQVKTVTTTHDGDLGRSFGGVLCAAVAAGNNYMWMQTRGIVPSCAVSTSVAAIGDTLGCRAAGSLTRFPVQNVSTAVNSPDLTTEPILGTAMQAASGGLADVMLHGRSK